MELWIFILSYYLILLYLFCAPIFQLVLMKAFQVDSHVPLIYHYEGGFDFVCWSHYHSLSLQDASNSHIFPILVWGSVISPRSSSSFHFQQRMGLRNRDLGDGCAHCSWGVIVSRKWMYINTYIHLYMSICSHVSVCFYIYLRVFPYLSVCVYFCIYLCLYFCIYLCISVFICVCILHLSVCVYFCIYLCVFLYLSACVYVCVYISVFSCVSISTFICIYVFLHLTVCISVSICGYVGMYVCIYLCVCISLFICVYVHTHTCVMKPWTRADTSNSYAVP